MEMEDYHEDIERKTKYFEKFRNMEPYFEIDEKEWT